MCLLGLFIVHFALRVLVGSLLPPTIRKFRLPRRRHWRGWSSACARRTIDFHMHALARADACAAPPQRFAGLAPAPLAVSLASSDSACSINRTLWHALDFLAPSTRLVVHIGCGSSATQEERRALGAISPRVLVNPRCESVDPKDGTPSPSPRPRPGAELESTCDHHHHPSTHPLPPPRHQARSSTPTCSTCGCSPPHRRTPCCSPQQTCAGSPQAPRSSSRVVEE